MSQSKLDRLVVLTVAAEDAVQRYKEADAVRVKALEALTEIVAGDQLAAIGNAYKRIGMLVTDEARAQ